MLTLTSLPWTGDLKVSGTLQPGQNWMTYKIPVGPTTQSLKVTITEPETESTTETAALDQVYLVGPSGAMLAEVTGASLDSVGARQVLTISLNDVPAGAELLVRIIENSAVEPTSPAPDTTPAVRVPFLMEVQRTELATPDLAVFQSTTGSVARSSVIVASGLVVAISPSGLGLSGDSATDSNATVAQNGNPNQAVTDGVIIARVASDSVDVPGATLGPLVLRGSGPLGPALGTAKGDPTPSIDRDERAFDLTAEGSGAGIDAELLLGLTARRLEGAAQLCPDSRPAGPRERAEWLNSTRGPGGFPVLSGAEGVEQSRNPAALLATVISAPEESAAENGLVAQITILPRSGFTPDQGGGQEASCTDFVTAAFGLVLCVGLTGGPLFPDLIALVRTCRPKIEKAGNWQLPRGSSRRKSLLGLRSWLFGQGG
jgi:hypothetical protein